MALAPNVYDAEPIPEAARAEIDRLMQSGDLFRYTAPKDAPVTLLEREFAAFMGTKFALAVSSCSPRCSSASVRSTCRWAPRC